MTKSKIFALALAFVMFAASSVSAAYIFNNNLSFGMRNAEVKELQMRLASEGFFSYPTFTEYYGPVTRSAVAAYQSAKSIAPAVGYTGPLTRAELNKGGSSTTLPEGCTSTSGFSTTTGASCATGTTTTLPEGCMAGYMYSPVTGQKCDATTTTPQTGPVTAMLAVTNPAANYIVSGQATAKLMDVTFSGTGTVNSVMLKRGGISDQNTLSAVYLYDGVNRLTDGYSFNSNGEITINNLNLAVSGSRTVSVMADVAGTSGQTISVSLASFMAAGQTAATVANLNGNLMAVASGSTLASIAWNGTNTVGAANVNAGTSSYAIWRQGVQVNTRALSLKAANFRITGSAPSDALANVKLYVDGVDTGKTASMMMMNGSNYAVFDMSTAPVSLNTGLHTLEVRADIVKGSSYSFTVSLQQASDLMVMDPQVGVNVAVTGGSSTAGTITILAGTATMTIDPTFNAITNVTGGASNATIAKYKIHGYGEDVKVYQVDITPVLGTMTPTAAGLQNVTLYFNGSQVGTQVPSWTSGAITFSLGSQMIIPAGTDSTLEVKADLRTTGGNNYTNGTISANASIAAAQMEGITSHVAPASSLSSTGNTLTVQTATLGVSQNVSYASQTVSPNTAAQKIGSFILQNQSSSESVRVTSLQVALGGTALTTNFGGLYTSENTGYKIQPQTSNVFSVDFTLAPGQTKTVDIFADTNSATGVNVVTTLTVASIGVSSNVSTTSAGVVGQTITLNAGTLTNPPVFLASNSTNSQYLASPAGKTDASKATYTFNSTNGPSTISELKFTVTGANTVSAVKVGTVSAPVVAGVAWLQGLNIAVPNGGSGTNVDALVSYTTVGTAGTASVTSGTTSQIALTYVKYNSGGTTADFTPSVAANTMTLTAATPTVKKTSSPVSVGVGTTSNVKVGTVTVTANDGDIKVGNLPVTVSSLGSNANWVVKVNGTAPSGITQPTSDTSGFSFAGGYQIQSGTSVAFDIYADVTNSGTTAGNVDVTLGDPATFTWSDIVDGVMTKTGTLLTTYNQ